ncbi:MAG: metallophosphoesterase family protein [Planctomycetes bacterium]|nr:metallophosphoesterase family protein [Planctomycetota bacterium]
MLNRGLTGLKANTRSSLSAIMLLIVLLAAATPAFSAITKGPVLLRVEQQRMALMWETDTPGPSRVTCTGPYSFKASASTNPIAVEFAPEGSEQTQTVYIHKLWLDGLSAGTTYEYQIAAGSAKSKRHQFQTVPRDTTRFRFVVLGDSRTNPENFRKIVEQIIKAKPAFVVHSGDLVTKGSIYHQWQEQFYDQVKGLAESTPIYAAKGNHDMGNGHFEKLFMPPGLQTNYSFDYGNLHYYCADNYSAAEDEQLKNLTTNLKASDKQWKFVSMHIPPLNIGGHVSAWEYPNALEGIAFAGADFVITGHSHIYERFTIIQPTDASTHSAVTYITSGGAGAPSYGATPNFLLAKADNRNHFCLFEVDDTKIIMSAIDASGKTFDSVEMIKTEGKVHGNYVRGATPLNVAQLYHTVSQSLTAAADAKAQKGKPMQITCKISNLNLPHALRATFRLQADKKAWSIGPTQSITVSPGAELTTAKLTATPLTDIKIEKKHGFQPPLSVHCIYQTPQANGSLTIPINPKK